MEQYSAQGYTIANYLQSGRYYAYKDTPVIKRMANWLAHLIVIDTPWSVKDETNPDLERGLRFGTTPTGGVALIGSGTTHKYLLYTDSRFPWIHQNIITLNFGTSYPTYQGLDVLRVLSSRRAPRSSALSPLKPVMKPSPESFSARLSISPFSTEWI